MEAFSNGPIIAVELDQSESADNQKWFDCCFWEKKIANQNWRCHWYILKSCSHASIGGKYIWYIRGWKCAFERTELILIHRISFSFSGVSGSIFFWLAYFVGLWVERVSVWHVSRVHFQHIKPHHMHRLKRTNIAKCKHKRKLHIKRTNEPFLPGEKKKRERKCRRRLGFNAASLMRCNFLLFTSSACLFLCLLLI